MFRTLFFNVGDTKVNIPTLNDYLVGFCRINDVVLKWSYLSVL